MAAVDTQIRFNENSFGFLSFFRKECDVPFIDSATQQPVLEDDLKSKC